MLVVHPRAGRRHRPVAQPAFFAAETMAMVNKSPREVSVPSSWDESMWHCLARMISFPLAHGAEASKDGERSAKISRLFSGVKSNTIRTVVTMCCIENTICEVAGCKGVVFSIPTARASCCPRAEVAGMIPITNSFKAL